MQNIIVLQSAELTRQSETISEWTRYNMGLLANIDQWKLKVAPASKRESGIESPGLMRKRWKSLPNPGSVNRDEEQHSLRIPNFLNRQDQGSEVNDDDEDGDDDDVIIEPEPDTIPNYATALDTFRSDESILDTVLDTDDATVVQKACAEYILFSLVDGQRKGSLIDSLRETVIPMSNKYVASAGAKDRLAKKYKDVCVIQCAGSKPNNSKTFVTGRKTCCKTHFVLDSNFESNIRNCIKIGLSHWDNCPAERIRDSHSDLAVKLKVMILRTSIKMQWRLLPSSILERSVQRYMWYSCHVGQRSTYHISWFRCKT